MDPSSFDLQNVGALSSILGLLPSFIQWFTSEYRARRGKKKEEASDVIQQYIEWLRRQRHEEILNKLSSSQEAMVELTILMEKLMAKSGLENQAILLRLHEIDSGLHEKLDNMRRPFKKPLDSSTKERQFEKEYLGHVKQEFERLRVLGISEMRQIRQELSIAYVSLNLKRTLESTEAELTDVEEEEVEDTESLSAEDVLCDNPLMTIRGPAGSGKTTLLRWLALQCARVNVETEENPWRNCIPFHIPLRSLEAKDQGRPKLERFLSYTIDPEVWTKKPPEGWINRVLEQERALILIDGIDELPPQVRPKFWIWLEKFVHHQPGNRVYVTSRPFPEPEDDSIGPLWNPPSEFVPAELDEMNDQDIKAFVNNWHDAVILHEENEQERLELQRARDRLPKRLSEPRNRSVRELCRTPLLCALVCAMHWREEGYLPASRIDLYDNCCTMLIELRDVKKDMPPIEGPLGSLTLKDKEMILRRLALEMMRNKTRAGTRQQIEISRGDCMKWVSLSIPSCASDEARKCQPVELINYLIERSGLLREPAKGRVDFPHRTFQEYLAACAAGEANDAGDLASRAGQDQWKETILLAAGTKIGGAPFGNALIQELVERGEQEENNKSLRHAYFALAVGCLETGGPNIHTNFRDRVLKHLKEITPPQSFEEARIIAAAGEVVLDYLSYSKIKGRRQSVEVVSACARTLSLIGSEKAVKMLEDADGYGKDRRVTVKMEICKCPNVNIKKVPSIWHWNYRRGSHRISPSLGPFIYSISPDNFPKNAMSIDLSGFSLLTDIYLPNMPELVSLDLRGCTSLTRLAFSSHQDKLSKIYLGHCPSLTRLVAAELPRNLSVLDLCGCTGLKSLVAADLPRHLSGLDLSRCTGLTRLVTADLPRNLSMLNLNGCTGLTSLTASDLPRKLSSLSIVGCNVLNKFVLADLPKNLSELNLSGWACKTSLKASDMPGQLSSLYISKSKSITSLALADLPNLSDLNLSDCTGITSLASSDLPKNLVKLQLSCCTGLTRLSLTDMPKLSYIFLYYCTGLTKLNASDLPKNLLNLQLYNCRNLKPPFPDLPHGYVSVYCENDIR